MNKRKNTSLIIAIAIILAFTVCNRTKEQTTSSETKPPLSFSKNKQLTLIPLFINCPNNEYNILEEIWLI